MSFERLPSPLSMTITAAPINVTVPLLVSVSIVTVTQFSRHKCLQNLSDLIRQQQYKDILEWVIVEGSPLEADAIKNAEQLEKMRTNIALPFPIVYVPYAGNGTLLSDLRNIGNTTCKGDIIVVMDDDDYYPPTRVSHAVDTLVNSSALIAGCSNIYIYFYQTNEFYQFNSFGNMHSTNNCLAYKKEYLLDHAHAPKMSRAEESSFTNGFDEPMEQLDPNKCIVVSGHTSNTVDKQWMCNTKPYKHRMFKEIDAQKHILDFIPLPIYLRMQEILI
jgi:glycosyltransferase involved in cell wall biosynthesis